MSPDKTDLLASLPRVRLVDGATPIHRLKELTRQIPYAGDVNVFVKRDDLMALGGGGNKLRKLEFLLGAARAEGADTIVTIGGLQSNHARLTAAAAARVGLHCEIILGRQVPKTNDEYEHGGNVFLNKLFGARVEVAQAGIAPLERARERMAELAKSGRRPYLVPTGGSTAIGSLGYVSCLYEILEQQEQLSVQFDHIVVANGSSGTHAGLTAGLRSAGKSPRIVQAFTTLFDDGASRKTTAALAEAALGILGQQASMPEDDILVDGSQRGPGYGIPTEDMKNAVLALARSEGILLDPVYSGKAFAGMLSYIREGKFKPGANVLFIMTGGTPSIYAYRDAFE
ncbi:1-aminocyclopropane-1-carboxylate deaminase [Herbaspirillum sp. CF444]|uniref:D-cysteine desulfhydrase family protein n=1 Tax=Herbaspirillum sp. CF444 TaxID=1144319 RepID=UPI0002727359|nr:D-cysteine desulfhydrase family protein [Herbaspirillum sp. CF444]EJL92382.1 1-aminocyclopropane-1-carboxylate deaminase [Herbaspirillum sp. CF444]